MISDMSLNTAYTLRNSNSNGYHADLFSIPRLKLVELRLKGLALLAPSSPELQNCRLTSFDVIQERNRIPLEILKLGRRSLSSERERDTSTLGFEHGRECEDSHQNYRAQPAKELHFLRAHYLNPQRLYPAVIK